MGRNAISKVMAAIDGERPEAPVIELGFQLMVRGSSSPRPA